MVKKKGTARWSVLSLKQNNRAKTLWRESEKPKKKIRSSTNRHTSRRLSAGRWFGRNCGTSIWNPTFDLEDALRREEDRGDARSLGIYFNTHECDTMQQRCRGR